MFNVPDSHPASPRPYRAPSYDVDDPSTHNPVSRNDFASFGLGLHRRSRAAQEAEWPMEETSNSGSLVSEDHVSRSEMAICHTTCEELNVESVDDSQGLAHVETVSEEDVDLETLRQLRNHRDPTVRWRLETLELLRSHILQHPDLYPGSCRIFEEWKCFLYRHLRYQIDHKWGYEEFVRPERSWWNVRDENWILVPFMRENVDTLDPVINNVNPWWKNRGEDWKPLTKANLKRV